MKKLLGLRIFEDENGKTNKSLADVDGQLLMVSQFTLYANCKKETVQASRKQASRTEQKNCMNIWSRKHGNRFLLSKRECSGLRWKYHW